MYINQLKKIKLLEKFMTFFEFINYKKNKINIIKANSNRIKPDVRDYCDNFLKKKLKQRIYKDFVFGRKKKVLKGEILSLGLLVDSLLFPHKKVCSDRVVKIIRCSTFSKFIFFYGEFSSAFKELFDALNK